MDKKFNFSKINNIFVELNNFKYTNGSNEEFSHSNEFIGRKKQIDNLNSILTNSNSKNGAYLVTGYRGVGKTSFVNKVLTDLNYNEPFKNDTARFIRILFIIVLFGFVNLNFIESEFQISTFRYDFSTYNVFNLNVFVVLLFSLLFSGLYLLRVEYKIINLKPNKFKPRSLNENSIWNKLKNFRIINKTWKTNIKKNLFSGFIFSFLLVFSLILLVSHSYLQTYLLTVLFAWSFITYAISSWTILYRERKNIQNKVQSATISVLNKFRKLFLVNKEETSSLKFYILVQDIFISLFIMFYAKGIIQLLKTFNVGTIYNSNYLVLYFVLSFTAIICLFMAAKFSYHKIYIVKRDCHFFDFLRHNIRNYFNFSDLIHVKINLSYDRLKEIDVLKLVSKNILNCYEKKHRITNLFELGWKAMQFLLIYVLFSIFYYQTPFYSLNNDIKIKSGIIYYFPSQGYFLCDDSLSKNEIIIPEKIINIGNSKLDAVDYYLETFRNHVVYPGFSHLFYSISDVDLENNLSSKIRFFSVYVDYNLYSLYQKIYTRINTIFNFDNQKLKEDNNSHFTLSLSREFKLIPRRIDYLFWIYLFVSWFVINIILNSKSSSLITSGYIKKRLRDLNEKIEAQIVNEKGISTPDNIKKNLVNIFGRKTKSRDRADIREIESDLIDIFEDVDRMPRILRRPQFIIVFDEIDKIEPHKNISIIEKEEENTNYDFDEVTKLSMDGNRMRQQKIFRLLSNLKHFLNTAKSKFIFIAGREMYDAALADISDRNFFIGSIFNDVIYVDSFLKDQTDKRTSEVTSLTERYVCQFLLPYNFIIQVDINKDISEKLNLEYFSLYLQQKKYKPQEIEKVIVTLKNFINYITYRSNGAPKKITSLFEKYIVPKDKFELAAIEERKKSDEYQDDLIVNVNYSQLFLYFGYTSQYIFGMTSYLINPFFLSINRSINDFTDKLLISSSFIIDHLYKFHTSGFSWRNIELIPEIVDINKAPHLRNLITTFIKSLNKTHLQYINNGLFKFKFNKKIEEEIIFISKKNEQESAAYNFTLDESLAIKRHFRKQLSGLEKTYKEYFSASQSRDYLSSISYLHSILGDLHYYDQEYDDAIIEYNESVQLFGENKFENLSIEAFVTLLRNTLKLGLTYEKKKTYEPAYLIYGKLATRLIKYKNGELSQKLSKKVGKELLLELMESDNMVPFEYLSFRYNIIETLKLFQQPLLAKFHLKEKLMPLGITEYDYNILNKEYDELFKDTRIQDNGLLDVEFKSRVGDILFFKNGSDFYFSENKGIDNQLVYCQKEKSLCSINKNIKILTEKGNRIPCNACNLYMENLKIICKDFMFFNFANRKDNSDKQLILLGLIGYLVIPNTKSKFEKLDGSTVFNTDENDLDKYKSDYLLKLTGNILSDVGDTFLSCSSENEKISKNFIIFISDIMVHECTLEEKFKKLSNYFKNMEDSNSALSKLEETLFYYYLSGYYFWRAMEYRELTFQYIKILYVLSEYTKISEIIKLDQFKKVLENICQFALQGVFKTYNEINFLEYEDMNTFFKNMLEVDIDKIKLKNTTLNWDFNEVIYLYKRIIIKMENKRLSQTYIENLEKMRMGNINSLSNVNSMFNRIRELNLQSELNKKIYKKLKRIYVLPRKIAEIEYLKNLICDSIFCNYEILRVFKVYGVSYLNNYSNMGFVHRTLAYWCEERDNLLLEIENTLKSENYYIDEEKISELKNEKNAFDNNIELISEKLININKQLVSNCIATGENYVTLPSDYHSLTRTLIYYKKVLESKKYSLFNLVQAKSDLEERLLGDLISKDNIIMLNKDFNKHTAMNYFRSAMEMHKEGQSYKDLMEELYSLNDDFNENYMHFFCSLERYKIKISNMVNIVLSLNTEALKTKQYDIKNYM